MTPLSANGYHYDCPVCGAPMERRATGGPGARSVGIEVCDRCLGVWLPAASVRHLADPRAKQEVSGKFGEGLRHVLHTIERLIYTDPLTGVRNRRSFDLQLPASIREANGRYAVSLLFVDLDGFKDLNDTAGHQAGDCALRAFGRLLTQLLRPMDHIARYGGDEFAAILPETDAAEAAAVVERLDEHIGVARREGFVPVGASVGAATYPDDGRTAEALLAAADAAMYRVKRGRGRARNGTAAGSPAAATSAPHIGENGR